MKTLLLIFTFAAGAGIVKAQSSEQVNPTADKNQPYYIAPVTTIYDSRYMMYDHTEGTKDNPSNLYLTDKITYHQEYDIAYNAASGTSFAQPALVVKSRVDTRVVFMPDCIQSYLYQQYGVSKWKHATVVRTADEHVYYEVNVQGKNFRFDDICNVNRMGETK